MAHFYRFHEIVYQRKLIKVDNKQYAYKVDLIPFGGEPDSITKAVEIMESLLIHAKRVIQAPFDPDDDVLLVAQSGTMTGMVSVVIMSCCIHTHTHTVKFQMIWSLLF